LKQEDEEGDLSGLPIKLALQEVEAGQQQRRRGQRVIQHGRQSLQPLG
jgi:hypothetical protein